MKIWIVTGASDDWVKAELSYQTTSSGITMSTPCSVPNALWLDGGRLDRRAGRALPCADLFGAFGVGGRHGQNPCDRVGVRDNSTTLLAPPRIGISPTDEPTSPTSRPAEQHAHDKREHGTGGHCLLVKQCVGSTGGQATRGTRLPPLAGASGSYPNHSHGGCPRTTIQHWPN